MNIFPQRIDQLFELLHVVGHRSTPHATFHPTPRITVIQRKPEFILLFQIVSDFFTIHLPGQDIEPQNLIPNKIIFLTPTVGQIESQAVMITVISHLFPLQGHFASLFRILLCFWFFQHGGQFAISGNSHDRFS